MTVLLRGHLKVRDMGAMGACQWETRATITVSTTTGGTRESEIEREREAER